MLIKVDSLSQVDKIKEAHASKNNSTIFSLLHESLPKYIPKFSITEFPSSQPSEEVDLQWGKITSDIKVPYIGYDLDVILRDLEDDPEFIVTSKLYPGWKYQAIGGVSYRDMIEYDEDHGGSFQEQIGVAYALIFEASARKISLGDVLEIPNDERIFISGYATLSTPILRFQDPKLSNVENGAEALDALIPHYYQNPILKKLFTKIYFKPPDPFDVSTPESDYIYVNSGEKRYLAVSNVLQLTPEVLSQPEVLELTEKLWLPKDLGLDISYFLDTGE